MIKILMLLAFLILISPFSVAYIGTAGVDFVPNQIIVKFNPGTNIQNRAQAKLFLQGLSPEIISNSQKAFPVIKKINTVGLDRIYVIDYNPNIDLEKIINAYKNNPNIEYAEPNWYGQVQTVPNDPNYPNILSMNQSGLRSITPENAWSYTSGDSNIIVAIPDSGVGVLENNIPFTHQELINSIYINTNEILQDNIDNDNNGCIDDYYGCDINLYDGKNLSDLSTTSHGTRIAGIIAANTNNALGMAGTCWNCKIMVIKISTSGDLRTELSVSRGVRYAIDNNANIISMSTAFSTNSSLLIDSATDANRNDTIYIAAAGNQNNNVGAAIYPGSYNTVLGIAGLDDKGKRWNSTSTLGTNYGLWVDVSAPAVKIISTLRNGNVGLPNSALSGTSFAAPFVAGQAGLILSMWPGLTKAQVEHIIKSTADNIDSLNPGFEGQLGTGRINLTRSLEFGCSDQTRLRTCNGPFYCDFIGSSTTTALNVNITMCGSCSDTDSGINENVTGQITYFDDTGTQVTQKDTCQNKNSLTEYYCQTNQSQTISISCGTGRECAAGACIQAQPKTQGGSPIYKKARPSDTQQSPGEEILAFLIPISRFLRFIIPVI